MGSCTSAERRSQRRRGSSLTPSERRLQNQLAFEDMQREQEREVAERINQQKLILRQKAMPMIMKRASCEDILDISRSNSETEFEELVRKSSRSFDSNDSDLDTALSSLGDDSTSQDGSKSSWSDGKAKILEQMNHKFEQEENDSMAVLRVNKKMKRRRAKQDAENENKWMIFRDLDSFDEADMVKVAKFMQNLFKVKGKLEKDESKNDALRALGALETPMDQAAEARRLLAQPQGVDSPSREGKWTSSNMNNSSGTPLLGSGKKPRSGSDLGVIDRELQEQKKNGGIAGTTQETSGIIVDRTVSASSVLSHQNSSLSNHNQKFPNMDRNNADNLPQPPTRSFSSDGGGNNNFSALHGDMSASELSTPTRKGGGYKSPNNLKVDTIKSPVSGRGPDDGLISVGRENSMESLLRRGQVVITPTTAMGGASIRTPNTPNSITSSPRSPLVSSNAKHSDVLQNELNSNFDLQNFKLPSGFITPMVSKAVVDVFKQGGKLSKESVHKLLRLCYRSFQTLPNTTDVTIAEGERLTVIGDIHGQLPDLLYILGQSGLPSTQNKYIFNGDFVDRGAYGVEVMCILMSLYLSNPGQVTLNRGNHEDFAICCAYGFQAECCTKYDDITFGMFVEVFNHLPLFAVVNERVFVLHGGLFHTADVKLAELNLIKRTDFSLKDIPDGGDGTDNIPRDQKEEYLKQLQRDALWSDPSGRSGLSVSTRGAGVMFGPDIARKFCETNNISLVVRSHECCRSGFDLPYANALDEEDRNTVCTIFSASNYGGGGNSAAYMVFTRVPLNQDGTKRKKKEKGKVETHVKVEPTDVPNTDMQYEVNYFHIDDEAAEDLSWMRTPGGVSDSEYETDDDASITSQVSLTGDLSLHQLILRKRSLLLKHFELADPSASGYVLKDTWADVMQRVLSLHISWITMFPVLVDEESVSYLTYDKGNRIDPTAVEGTTAFVSYERFLDHFSLSLETATDDFDSEDEDESDILNNSNHSKDSEGDVGVLLQPVDTNITAVTVTKSKGAMKKRNVSGQLVDSLYAHHNELSAIFSFFDMKKDQVISRAEFKAGCSIIRKLQLEEEGSASNGDSGESREQTDEEKVADAEFHEECDNLMDIMNLNGSGFIDINEFFEMFRVSEAMRRRTLTGQPVNFKGGRRNSIQKGVTVGTSGLVVSGD
jgi:hypothetical protein